MKALQEMASIAVVCSLSTFWPAAPLAAGTLAPPGPQIQIPDDPLCTVFDPQAALFDEREIWVWREGGSEGPSVDPEAIVVGAVFPPGGSAPSPGFVELGVEPTGELRLAQRGETAWTAWPTDSGLALRELLPEGDQVGGLQVTIGWDAPVEAVDLAVTPSGRVFVAWLEGSLDPMAPRPIHAQLFRADGSEATEPVQVDVAPAEFPFEPRGLAAVAVAEDRFAVTWISNEDAQGSRIFARPVREIATPGGLNPILLMPEDRILVSDGSARVPLGASVESSPEAAPTPLGGFVVAWNGNVQVDPPFPQTFLRRFDAEGQALGPEQTFDSNDVIPISSARPGLSVGDQGRIVVTWEAFTRDFSGPPGAVLRPVAAVLLSPQGEPLDEAFQVNVRSDLVHRNPSPAFGADGDLLVTWDEGPEMSPLSAAPPCSGVGNVVHGRRFDTGCAAAAVCVLGDRFEATVVWDDPFNGGSGVGTGLQLTGDTGAFWFFEKENLELMVKVLDGRVVNNHFWVFFGSLTNVEFTLTVRDRATDRVRTYHNPPFTFASEGDTTAFRAGVP